MTLPTEKDRKKKIREEIRTCDDPSSLLTDLVYDNERLRAELNRWQNGTYKH